MASIWTNHSDICGIWLLFFLKCQVLTPSLRREASYKRYFGFVSLFNIGCFRLHIRLKRNVLEHATGRTDISVGFQHSSFVLRTTQITNQTWNMCACTYVLLKGWWEAMPQPCVSWLMGDLGLDQFWTAISIALQAQGKPCRWINHAQAIRAQDVRRCGRSCFDSNPKIQKLICLRFLQSCLEDSWGFDEDVVGPLNHSVVWAQNLSALEAVHIFGTCAWMHKRRNMNCFSGKIMEPTPYHHLFVMKSFFTR